MPYAHDAMIMNNNDDNSKTQAPGLTLKEALPAAMALYNKCITAEWQET
jgi:hypothetical protein